MRVAPSFRPGLLQRYLLTRLVRPGLTAYGLVLTAMLLERTLRLIRELSTAGGRLGFVFPLMADTSPYYFALALPAAFFVAMFVVFADLDEAGEVEAMLAGGVSFRRIVAPYVAVGLALAALHLLIGGFGEPFGRYGFRMGQIDAAAAGWSAHLDPRVVASPSPDVALTADSVAFAGRRLRGVMLVQRKPDGRETITTGATGSLSLEHGGRDVALEMRDGAVYAEEAAGPRIGRFANLRQLNPAGRDEVRRPRGSDDRELTLTELIGQLAARHPQEPRATLGAEVMLRVFRAGSLPLLPLLALPLALAVKRGKRVAGMIVAAVILVTFHHGLQLAKSFVATGEHSTPWLMLVLGLIFAGLCIFTFVSSSRRPGDNFVSWTMQALERAAARLPKLPEAPKFGRFGLAAYVGGRLAVYTVSAAAGLLALQQVVDLQEMTPRILARHFGVLGVLRYEALRFPSLVQELAPFAMLIAAVLTFGELLRRNESVAMRAAGVSSFRVLGMLAPIALAVAVADLVMVAEAAPAAQRALAGWWGPEPGSNGPALRTGALWFRSGDEVVAAGSAASDGARLQQVRIYRRGDDRTLDERLTAREAVWRQGGGWTLDGVTQTHTASTAATPALRQAEVAWPTRLTPREVRRMQGAPEELSSSTLAAGLLTGAPTNRSEGYRLTRLHRTLAEPIAPLVMLLLASPLFAGPQLRGGGGRWHAFAFGGGLLYLVVDGLLAALGEAGQLPPFVAAWAGPAIFAALGTMGLLQVER